MARQKKPAGEKFVAHQIVFSPDVWADLTRLVPLGHRSAFVDAAVNAALDPLRIKELQAKLKDENP